MSRTIIPTFFENRVRWKMDLPVLPNQAFRADKHRGVVNYSLDLALLGHAEDDVNTVLLRHALNLPRGGTRDRLCQMKDLVLHGIARQMELRKNQQIDILLSSLGCLFRDQLQVSLFVSDFGTGLGE